MTLRWTECPEDITKPKNPLEEVVWMSGIFPQSGITYFLSTILVLFFKHSQLFVGQADSNKTSDPNDQSQMIPNSEIVWVLYKNQKGEAKRTIQKACT